jgi:thioredoxin 1
MTYQEFQDLLGRHGAVLLYFYNDSCGVCSTLWPRVEALMAESFPAIEVVRVDAGVSRELAGQLRMLSVPGILLFMDGRETLRANGMIALQELKDRIGRPYGMMF